MDGKFNKEIVIMKKDANRNLEKEKSQLDK
jgi:hypothetical protein